MQEAPEEYIPIGWSDKEIEFFENQLGKKLPVALKEYLLWGGNVAGPLEQRFDMPFERTLSLKENEIAIKYLNENRDSQPQFHEFLPQDALVLSTSQGYHFWFIRLTDNNNDPAVYEWMDNEDRTSFEKKFEHFSDYLSKIVDGYVVLFRNRKSRLASDADDEITNQFKESQWQLYLYRKGQNLRR
ncbi:MAG: SMI1/KNR4 family protein [Bacteroidota bacterium]|nr:SMI1/KNR4 family protein [Bacteroidota bacterium]